MATLNDLEKAIRIAVEAHSGQTDKASAPYILHPLRVMLSCDTDDEKIAAVLHDVIEDTETTTADLLAEGFPPHIVEAVDTLTRRKGEEYEDFIERVKQNPLASRVKIADLRDNLDVTRLLKLSEHDIIRLNKYVDALKILK